MGGGELTLHAIQVRCPKGAGEACDRKAQALFELIRTAYSPIDTFVEVPSGGPHIWSARIAPRSTQTKPGAVAYSLNANVRGNLVIQTVVKENYSDEGRRKEVIGRQNGRVPNVLHDSQNYAKVPKNMLGICVLIVHDTEFSGTSFLSPWTEERFANNDAIALTWACQGIKGKGTEIKSKPKAPVPSKACPTPAAK